MGDTESALRTDFESWKAATPVRSLKPGERIVACYLAGPDDDLSAEGYEFKGSFPSGFSIWMFKGSAK